MILNPIKLIIQSKDYYTLSFLAAASSVAGLVSVPGLEAGFFLFAFLHLPPKIRALKNSETCEYITWAFKRKNSQYIQITIKQCEKMNEIKVEQKMSEFDACIQSLIRLNG